MIMMTQASRNEHFFKLPDAVFDALGDIFSACLFLHFEGFHKFGINSLGFTKPKGMFVLNFVA